MNEEIIKKAIQGGYPDAKIPMTILGERYLTEKQYLDPTFWQAIGRAKLWSSQVCKHCGYPALNLGVYCGGCDMELELEPHPEWLHHALRYFELKLTNGDTEKFWSDLLKK